ncbi:GAF and ANTAR domain-containing protein [Streptomyces acidiscabies]|uniref:Cell wall protein n=1 Tax=Streptomyces acidiscabies TaxID=42234 RepID=A0A0L0JKX6_9ACTN|nr:GAF and ANTAR domain-containing protein [Streptomyces acidiscabies]KND26263.1 cell wall protein [Streptomyces acidiscabies]
MDSEGHRADLGLAAVARRRAALARERADRAETAAERHELLATKTGQEIHTHIAMTHRRTAECHRASARLQDSFAFRAAAWAGGRGTRPRFMTVVAEACGTDSAAIALLDADQNQLAVAVSDQLSSTAQDLEYVLGEGPGQDVAAGHRPMHVSRPEIEARWPGYGASLIPLGIDSVAAVPLRTQDGCIGSLTVFNPRPADVRPARLAGIAEVLTHIVLLDPDADPDLYGGTDVRATVHQAVGALSEQIGCSIADALALIKARAFAEEVSPDIVARQILHGDRKLT